MAEHPYDAEIVQENVRVPKSDGGYVQGVRMRDVLRKTEAVKAKRELSQKYNLVSMDTRIIILNRQGIGKSCPTFRVSGSCLFFCR